MKLHKVGRAKGMVYLARRAPASASCTGAQMVVVSVSGRESKHTHTHTQGCVPVVDVEVGVAGLGHARGDEGVGHLLERGLIVVAPERVPRVPAHRRRSFGPK